MVLLAISYFNTLTIFEKYCHTGEIGEFHHTGEIGEFHHTGENQ